MEWEAAQSRDDCRGRLERGREGGAAGGRGKSAKYVFVVVVFFFWKRVFVFVFFIRLSLIVRLG
jgi:hypothetical protein